VGKDLRRCLEVIHHDIVFTWNFPRLLMVRRLGPTPIVKTHSFQLYQDEFRGKVSKLVADLEDPERPSPNDSM
jgi:hypothetical protein